MRIYKKQNVYEATLDRIRFLFDEFPSVVPAVSGGKDSTVIFHLCIQVAREKNRLPLKVMFIDQEAEWDATIEQITYHMYHPDVEPKWYQMPMRLFNATSATEHWLNCWDPAEESRWMRTKDPISIKENHTGENRFHKMFAAILSYEYPDTETCIVGGVRAEEAPTRFVSLTHSPKYKWVTWGKCNNKRKQHYTFYPIYDWSYTDVWKMIHDEDLPYNRIYDAQYQYGYPVNEMRVSNVHHETAVKHLFFMQELEPDTYERLANRIDGVDMAGKMGKDNYFVTELPFMFKDWREYRDYLLEKLIDNPEWRQRFENAFSRQENEYLHELGDKLFKVHIQSILTNDWEGVKLANLDNAPNQQMIRKRNRGKVVW